MALLKKNGKELKKFIDSNTESKADIKQKKILLKKYSLNNNLLSWPKDREGLVNFISLYLSYAPEEEVVNVNDMPKEENNNDLMASLIALSNEENKDSDESQVELIDSSEYKDLPDEAYDIAECNDKVLRLIVRILYARIKSLRAIEKMKAEKVANEKINEEIEKVKIYNLAFAKYLPILNNQKTVDTATLATATKLFEEVCSEGYEDIPAAGSIETEIRKNKEEQDFDIISALAYVGVNVAKNDNGEFEIKNTNNGNGIKYFVGKQEKSYSLSSKSANKFINDFLNKPIENRKYMTPGQVFIKYIGEAESSFGIKTHTATELAGLFGTHNTAKSAKAYFKEIINRYSRNSSEWKDFQRLYRAEFFSEITGQDSEINTLHVKQHAKRLVIGEMFQSFINEKGILSDAQIEIGDYRISDISRDFGLDASIDSLDNKSVIEKLESRAFRLVNKMHNSIQDMDNFTQDIIDNYTMDYLRKEKIFMLKQDDQNDYIDKKKAYEDLIEKLSIDKSKDASSQISYYQQQVDDLSEKIGSNDYIDAKNDLLNSKNNFRILILNAKTQKELVKIELDKAKDLAEKDGRTLDIDEKLTILRSLLSSIPELMVSFEKGKAVTWLKQEDDEKPNKKSELLSSIDKIIEETTTKISDESHQKIMEENKLREQAKKEEREERVKSLNAYMKAYDNIVGKASEIGSISIGGGAKGSGSQNVVSSSNEASSSNINVSNAPQNVNVMGGNGFAMQNGMMAGYVSMMPNMMMNGGGLSSDYQNFDFVNDNIEPCVIPYVVGYESKGATIYGNMLENYATFDRYKFLLTTNNNALYSYIDNIRSQIKKPEEILSDLHTRYLKNALAKSGLTIPDSSISLFDYKSDLKKFLQPLIPQNLVDMVISDYQELLSTINIDMLIDLIQHKFDGDIENYIPETIKQDIVKCANMIASIIKAITSNAQVKKTYEAYSNKMKQTYINSVIAKIESGDIPTVKLSTEEIYSRMIDYISFSIKAQNVIIQNEDAKDSGLNAYPRSIFFIQKNNADNNLKAGAMLSFEQNELITTRNEPSLEEIGENIINLFGTLYKFNGSYNKLLLKLKPYNLTGSVKFMENLVDALNEKIDMKINAEALKKNNVSVVKFTNKDKAKKEEVTNVVFDYEDEKWFVRKGFVLDKQKIKEYSLLLAFGMKYGLDKEKKRLKEDFYDKNILSLNKINEAFKGMPEDMINLLTSVIRNVMMSNVERFVDFIDNLNKQFAVHLNKMLYVGRMALESNSFGRKTDEEKLNSLEAFEYDFNKKSEDTMNSYPEIYSSYEDGEKYKKLYLYYALASLYENFGDDKKIISDYLTNYFEDLKKQFRSNLISMIRNKETLNGYELELAKYFELDKEQVVGLEEKSFDSNESKSSQNIKSKIKNIDVIFKGIYDGFERFAMNESQESLQDEISSIRSILNIVGTLSESDTVEKDLEISLPNNQTIICNIKGFIQQYLFRYIVNKDHELGPFAYVLRELLNHEEYNEIVQNLEPVAEILVAPELGINLIAKFSSISLSNDGNILKIGDNISTVVDIINRRKSHTNIQSILNKDVFYNEAVVSVEESFREYFTRKNSEMSEMTEVNE